MLTNADDVILTKRLNKNEQIDSIIKLAEAIRERVCDLYDDEVWPQSRLSQVIDAAANLKYLAGTLRDLR